MTAMQGSGASSRAGRPISPKPRGMTLDSYEAYLNRAVYFGIYRRTIGSMLGLLYNRDPTIVVDSPLPV